MDCLIIAKQLKHFTSLSQTSHITANLRFSKQNQVRKSVLNFLMFYNGYLSQSTFLT